MVEPHAGLNAMPKRGWPLLYSKHSRCVYFPPHLQVAKRELALECDYEYEARCQKRFKQLVEGDPAFPEYMRVPAVVDELSGKTVLCSEYVSGVHIDKVSTVGLPANCSIQPCTRIRIPLGEVIDLCSECVVGVHHDMVRCDRGWLALQDACTAGPHNCP